MCVINNIKIKTLKRKILRNETPKTYELVASRFKLTNIKKDDFDYFGLDKKKREMIVDGISSGRNIKVGPYQLCEYFDMFMQLDGIAQSLYLKNLWSRQHVITFRKLHCFQNIQFLFRDEKVIVVVNMRSCNYVDNLLMDIYLATFCGHHLMCFVNEFNTYCTFNQVDVIMNIGSLHIFKE